MDNNDTSDNSLYIHIPFCNIKCGYCDFLSFDDKQSLQEAYKDALLQELYNCMPSNRISTIYIGGGTPTALPAPLLNEILNSLPPCPDITCEANPDTLTAEKINTLKAGGVNRISLGLQAAQPHLLHAIGRKGDTKTFTDSFINLRNAGFSNINVDIMFALPRQTLEEWDDTLKLLIDLNPEHISAYALTPDVVDEKTDRLMYHHLINFLDKHGYKQYEISNFCKPGFESTHNIRYWTLAPYTGFGIGAHSFDGKMRWQNTSDIHKYTSNKICAKNIREEYIEADILAETIIMGLRMNKGVPTAIIPDTHYFWVQKMKTDGLLQQKDDRISLTSLGMDLANIIMLGFLE